MIISKNSFFKILIFLSCIAIHSGIVYSKHIIWDLGGVLFKPSKFGISRNIGLFKFALYPLTTGRNPYVLDSIAFNVLGHVDMSYLGAYNLPPTTDKGRIVPDVMRHWLAGTDTNENLLKRAYATIEQLKRKHYFVNRIEYGLVKGLVNFIFDPVSFAYYTRPIRSGVGVLNECFNNKHDLYILSNWDRESFEYLYYSSRGQEVFRYFKKKNMVISGNIHMIKPDKKIFKYMLKRYNLNPQDCVFIDDQVDNIKAAQKCGITGVHLKDYNYRQLRRDLQKLKILN